MTDKECECPPVPPTPSTPTNWISLSFDGRIFRVLRSTLEADRGSLLYNLFSDDSMTNSMLDRDHTHPHKPFLFDRNPAYFEPILNYLRTGELVIDPGVSHRGVLLEAQYFHVQAIVDALQAATPPQTFELSTPTVKGLTRHDIERALITTRSATQLRFQGIDLSGLNLSGLDFSNANFTQCFLNGTDLSRCNLMGAIFNRCTMTHTILVDANMRKAICQDATLCDAKLTSACCASVDFTRSKLIRANLRFTDLTEACMSFCDLSHADLSATIINGTIFRQAILVGVERQGTNFSMGGIIA
jgi:BTB/POZ domain-containing protein KCTD9